MPKVKKNKGQIAKRVFDQPIHSTESKEVRMERIRWKPDGSHIIEFGKIYLPHIFRAENPEFHREIVASLTDHDRAAFGAPRGHAKSSIISLALPLYHAVTHDTDLVLEDRKKDFMLLIQNTQDMSEEQLDDIRQELEDNEQLREDFGDLIGGGKWTQKKLDLSNGVKIRAKGAGVSMRGLIKRGIRPKLIIGDDVDGEDAAESRSQCAKYKRWWRRVVTGLLGAEGGQILIVGTILHWDALLPDMLNNKAYYSKIYKAEVAWDEDGNCIATLWPNYWTVELLAAKKKEMGSQAYASEYMNNPVDPETQSFTWELLEPILYDEKDVNFEGLSSYGATDPAIGLKLSNDFFVHLAGITTSDGRIWVHDGICGRFKFDRQVDIVLEFDLRYNYIRCGVENVAYQDALKQRIQKKGQKRRQYIRVFPLPAKGSKDDRIATLVDLIEQGTIRINKKLKWLIEQLLLWPRGDHDDGPDCLDQLVRTIRGTGTGGCGFSGGVRMVGRDPMRDSRAGTPALPGKMRRAG